MQYMSCHASMSYPGVDRFSGFLASLETVSDKYLTFKAQIQANNTINELIFI